MTISTSLVTLGTAAQEVVGPSAEPQFVTMHNMTKSSNEYVFYGNATVGTGNAPHMDPGDTVQLRLMPGESLHALSNPSGLELGLFVQTQEDN